jgi:DNA-binding transcriptional MerR regulator/methylmalonyl-CoA mutase cobalamin-binding subunit
MGSMTAKALVKLSGIKVNTLRAWERRYGALSGMDQHTKGVRRTYDLSDLERLRVLMSLVEAGHPIGVIAGRSTFDLKRLQSHIGSEHSEKSIREVSNSHEQARKYLERSLSLIADFRIEELSENLLQSRLKLGSHPFIFDVIVPLLFEVGQLTLRRELSIGQEHILSSLVRVQLNALILNSGVQEGRRARFVLTTPEGDFHELGILIARCLFAVKKVPVYYLGPNMPEESLAQTCEALGADTVLIGSAEWNEGFLKKPFSKYLRELDRKLPRNVRIWVGGRSEVKGLRLSGASKARALEFFSDLNALDRALS